MIILISEYGSSRLKRKKDMIENCMAAHAKDLHDMNADVVKEDALIMKTVREIIPTSTCSVWRCLRIWRG